MLIEYRTVAKEAEITLLERKSRFIARIKSVQSVEQAEEFIAGIRKTHWSATHNVPAYILGTNREIQKFSDDQEPGGTAGLPALEMLKAHELVNVVTVITRYYGGIQLGRGGLIRAYGGAVKAVIEAAGLVRMVPAQRVALSVNYVLAGKIENELITSGIILKSTEYLEEVTFQILLLEQQRDAVKQMIRDLTSNAFSWVESGEIYCPRKVKKDGEETGGT